MPDQRSTVGEAELESAERGVLAAARRYGVALSQPDLEDLVQDTMVRLLERPIAKIRHRAAYVARVAHNVFVDSLRRRIAAKRDERLTVPLEGKQVGHASSPEERQLDRHALREALEECRRVLPGPQLAVFVLAQVWGFSGAETAALCGVSVSCTYARLRRARQSLRDAGLHDGKASC